MPQSGSEHVPGHENWFHCDGVCEDAPRNREFSHGFGSRYEFPLPEVENAPVPSNADYSPKNVAWLIEMFAAIVGVDESQVCLLYENNTPKDRGDDIYVCHPQDKLYYDEAAKCRPKSPEQERYEEFAKKSALLKLYEENSPAGIQYFQPLCNPETDT